MAKIGNDQSLVTTNRTFIRRVYHHSTPEIPTGHKCPDTGRRCRIIMIKATWGAAVQIASADVQGVAHMLEALRNPGPANSAAPAGPPGCPNSAPGNAQGAEMHPSRA